MGYQIYDKNGFYIGSMRKAKSKSKLPFWIGIAGLILMLIIALAERTVN